jgi:small subunit ribosomal protein S17
VTEEEKNQEQAEESPAPEEAPEEVDAAPAEEAVEEAVASPAEEAVEEAAPAEEREAPLPPKERRRLKRSRHEGESRPERSAEERAAERAAARREKAAGRRRYRARLRERRRAEGGAPAEAPTPEPGGTGKPKLRQGVVVSDGADKTITVRIDVARPHRMYGKIVRTSSTLHAHDERNEAHVGDTVRVVETRPLSRSKRWRLVEVLERAR